MSNSDVFRNIRLYASAQNLFTITNYEGINPDVRPVDQDNNPLAPGIDRRNNWFLAKTFTFGFNVGF